MTPQQKFEAQMGMLRPEFQERFYKELHEFFEATKFPSDVLPANFDKMRFAALVHIHPVNVQQSANAFNNLLLGESFEEYNLGNMVIICNGHERTTLMDWIILFGYSDESKKNFAYFLEAMEQLTIQVNEMIEPEKDKLLRKMMTLQKLPVNGVPQKQIHLPS